jgi:hypothetical protein
MNGPASAAPITLISKPRSTIRASKDDSEALWWWGEYIANRLNVDCKLATSYLVAAFLKSISGRPAFFLTAEVAELWVRVVGCMIIVCAPWYNILYVSYCSGDAVAYVFVWYALVHVDIWFGWFHIPTSWCLMYICLDLTFFCGSLWFPWWFLGLGVWFYSILLF